MADWHGGARSNYFKVKDEETFKTWTRSVCDLGYWEKGGLFAIYSEDEFGGWPSCRYMDERDEYEDIDLVEELAEHLIDGEVAVLMEAGAEKLRYISGYAVAVNNTGKRISVSLNDIYELACKELGGNPTDAAY